MNDTEKSLIEEFFLEKNGMIRNDICVEFKTQNLPEEISIFQVTGYIVALHRKVTRGDLQVQDQESYKDYIGYHRAVWKSYNSPKYWSMRGKKFPKIRISATLQLAA